MTGTSIRRLKVEKLYSYRNAADVRARIRLQGRWLSRIFVPGSHVEVIPDAQSCSLTLRAAREERP